jgi:hypothetical protein
MQTLNLRRFQVEWASALDIYLYNAVGSGLCSVNPRWCQYGSNEHIRDYRYDLGNEKPYHPDNQLPSDPNAGGLFSLE